MTDQNTTDDEQASEDASASESAPKKAVQNKKGFIETEGMIEELLPAASFRVVLDNGHTVLAHLSGKMRMYKIRLVVGDRVRIEMSPYDLTKGRITYRL